MKKMQKKSKDSRVVKYLPAFYAEEPILKIGYPKAEDDEDDDDDESPDLSSILNQQKNPFRVISSNLYNIDYNNRIIVIEEAIDERCFIYAKMIENWNRQDKNAFYLKERVNKIISMVPEVRPLFAGFKLSEDESKDALANVEEKVKALLEKHPEVMPIFAELQANRIPQTDILSYEPTPIRIKFNSPGGWLLAYQTLADVIKLSKTKVIGINMGMAYSAAAFLLISCHERLALPKSRMMVHRGSGGNFGSFEQTESSQQNYKEQVDEMIDTFRKRTKIPMKVLKKNMNPDWYLSAHMALKYGMIDRIVTDINEIIWLKPKLLMKKRTVSSPLFLKLFYSAFSSLTTQSTVKSQAFHSIVSALVTHNTSSSNNSILCLSSSLQ